MGIFLPGWAYTLLGITYLLSILFCIYVIIKKEEKKFKMVLLTVCAIFVPLFPILYLIISAGELLVKRLRKA
jgi:hypothetical protein